MVQTKRATAAQIRITKDINELELPKTCNTEFPDPDDWLNFRLVISPDEGFYRGGRFTFSFKIGPNYPHEPPKVKCMNKIYHPNIDLDDIDIHSFHVLPHCISPSNLNILFH